MRLVEAWSDMDFDAVMVLGKELRRDPVRGRAELRARAAAASVAWASGVPRVMALEAHLRGQATAGSALVAADLRRHGVPDEALVLDTTTYSTRQEALAARERCEAEGWNSLLVITASYHLHRACRCFEEVLGADRVALVCPEDMLGDAGPLARGDILAGEVTAAAQRVEARAEAVLSTLGFLVSPLPDRWRWGLEVQAGTWLRR